MHIVYRRKCTRTYMHIISIIHAFIPTYIRFSFFYFFLFGMSGRLFRTVLAKILCYILCQNMLFHFLAQMLSSGVIIYTIALSIRTNNNLQHISMLIMISFVRHGPIISLFTFCIFLKLCAALVGEIKDYYKTCISILTNCFLVFCLESHNMEEGQESYISSPLRPKRQPS